MKYEFMRYDIMKYYVMKYDVMKYKVMKYEVMKYDIMKYVIMKMKKTSFKRLFPARAYTTLVVLVFLLLLSSTFIKVLICYIAVSRTTRKVL